MQYKNSITVMIASAILIVASAAEAGQYGNPPPGYGPPPAWPSHRNDPWADMRRMEREMRWRQWQMERRMRRMERDFDEGWRDNGSGIQIRESFSTPRIRIDEDAENYIVTASIPGADGKTIEVEQRGNRLRIAAMRQVEKRETGDGRRMRASFSSRYQRILTLPGPVMESGMQTDFVEDLLTIRVPKAN
jgi:HSP20 family protein